MFQNAVVVTLKCYQDCQCDDLGQLAAGFLIQLVSDTKQIHT